MTPPDKAAAIVATASGGLTWFGYTIAQWNEVLQAGAFMAAMVSGFGAGLYYGIKAIFLLRDRYAARRARK